MSCNCPEDPEKAYGTETALSGARQAPPEGDSSGCAPVCGAVKPDGMEIALDQARQALTEGEIPVGAVLMRGEQVLWADHNRREQRNDPTAHAEMLCLGRGAEKLGDWRLNECTLYVTLEPCPMCAGALVMSRLGRVVYGAADPEKGCCGSVYDLPADPAFRAETRWTAGAREEECARLLADFFRKRRKEDAESGD